MGVHALFCACGLRDTRRRMGVCMPTLEGARAPILLGARAGWVLNADQRACVNQSACIVFARATGGLYECAGAESCSKSVLLFVNNTADVARWTSCVSGHEHDVIDTWLCLDLIARVQSYSLITIACKEWGINKRDQQIYDLNQC